MGRTEEGEDELEKWDSGGNGDPLGERVRTPPPFFSPTRLEPRILQDATPYLHVGSRVSGRRLTVVHRINP